MKTFGKAICACGCGKEFEKTGPRSKYATLECKRRALGKAPAKTKSPRVGSASRRTSTRRQREPADLDAETTALQRAREFRRTASELARELRAQRDELQEQIDEIEAELEFLGGQTVASPRTKIATTVKPSPRAAEPPPAKPKAPGELCRHGVSKATCALCPRVNRISDEVATSRPGA